MKNTEDLASPSSLQVIPSGLNNANNCTSEALRCIQGKYV